MPACRHRVVAPSLAASILAGLSVLVLGAASASDGEARPAERSAMIPRAILLAPVQPPDHPASGQAPSQSQERMQAGALTLRNASPVGVRIEVRLASGTSQSCDEAPTGTVRVLPAGKRWLIGASRPICWRRALELPDGGSVTWTPWQRQILSPGQRLEAAP